MAGRSIGRGAVASSGQVMTATKTAMATITVTTISTEQMMFNTLARVLCFLAPSTSPSILQSRACGNTWRLGGAEKKNLGTPPHLGKFSKGSWDLMDAFPRGAGCEVAHVPPPHTVLDFGVRAARWEGLGVTN